MTLDSLGRGVCKKILIWRRRKTQLIINHWNSIHTSTFEVSPRAVVPKL